MRTVNGFGLRSKVEGRIKNYIENEKDKVKGADYARPVIPVSIRVAEDAYRFFENARKILCEVGCIPNSFYDLFDDDFGLRLHLKGLWKWLFSKDEPYSAKNILEWKNDDAFGLYKRWYVSAKNYIKQQMDHYASEYFAATIVTWSINNWILSLDDLWSENPSLTKRAEKLWKRSENWIKKQNKYIEENNE